MAATWTLLKATPYSACYRIFAQDANPGVLDYSDGATFLALVPGPYRNFIQKHRGNLTALNLSDAGDVGPRKRRIRIYRVSGAPAPTGAETNLDKQYTLVWVANGLSATMDAGGESGDVNLLIEIRFIHSSRR